MWLNFWFTNCTALSLATHRPRKPYSDKLLTIRCGVVFTAVVAACLVSVTPFIFSRENYREECSRLQMSRFYVSTMKDAIFTSTTIAPALSERLRVNLKSILGNWICVWAVGLSLSLAHTTRCQNERVWRRETFVTGTKRFTFMSAPPPLEKSCRARRKQLECNWSGIRTFPALRKKRRSRKSGVCYMIP
jgi:hypothetical protein